MHIAAHCTCAAAPSGTKASCGGVAPPRLNGCQAWAAAFLCATQHLSRPDAFQEFHRWCRAPGAQPGSAHGQRAPIRMPQQPAPASAHTHSETQHRRPRAAGQRQDSVLQGCTRGRSGHSRRLWCVHDALPGGQPGTAGTSRPQLAHPQQSKCGAQAAGLSRWSEPAPTPAPCPPRAPCGSAAAPPPRARRGLRQSRRRTCSALVRQSAEGRQCAFHQHTYKQRCEALIPRRRAWRRAPAPHPTQPACRGTW